MLLEASAGAASPETDAKKDHKATGLSLPDLSRDGALTPTPSDPEPSSRGPRSGGRALLKKMNLRLPSRKGRTPNGESAPSLAAVSPEAASQSFVELLDLTDDDLPPSKHRPQTIRACRAQLPTPSGGECLERPLL